MNIKAGIFTDVHAQLADGFQKGQAFNIPPTVPPISTKTTSISPFSAAAKIRFLISLVTWGNNLNGTTQKFTAPFLRNNSFINLPRAYITLFRQIGVNKPFVVT